MTRQARLFQAVLAMVLVLAGANAWAQAGASSSSLTGVVLDNSGGVIPGAEIAVKNEATGITLTAVTRSNGAFNLPAMDIGTYTVTVSLMGFKTAVLKNVVLNAGVPSAVRVTLEVGELAETVTVEGSSEVVQTQSSAVATTLNVRQIINLPLTTRNALDFLTLMPGVDTATGGLRYGNVMGLPMAAVNITLDGMNVQDNYNKTNEIFARVQPRLDAVEEVTFTSAAQGAESGGQGAVQMRFATRAGTNQLRGSAYFYLQNEKLNSNTWFNKRDGIEKPEVRLYQPGVRVGGPIVIPGLFDGHNKAFFFFNYEQEHQPSTIRNTYTVLSPDALAGNFLYATSSGARTVNLFELAARNGQLASFDPTVKGLLDSIGAATKKSGTLTALTNPSLQQYVWQQTGKNLNRYPTGRLDYNITSNHRLTGSVNAQTRYSNPDTTNSRWVRFPGFPIFGTQEGLRYAWQASLRSMLGRNLVNELRYGRTGGATEFNPNWDASMWNDTNQYHLNINGTMALTNAGSIGTGSEQKREAGTWVVEDSLNWQRGAHSLAIGASFTRINMWRKQSTPVPTVNFGLVSGDTAQSMFTAANFPGASSTQLTYAQNMYAMITGRVSSIAREARFDPATNKYVAMGESLGEGRMHDIGFYLQDAWRVKPSLTINAGLRYEIQLPFEALNNSYSNATLEDLWGVTGVAPDFAVGSLVNNIGYLYQPGVLRGTAPTYKAMDAGTKAYKTDWNNLGPSIGAAWTPAPSGGWRRKLVGNPGDTVLRGGFSVAYQRNGMGDFVGVLGANPGISIDITRSQSIGNLGTIPLLFRNSGQLGAPAFAETRTYPMPPPTVTGSVNLFDPNIQVPYARTWTVGWQRALGKNTAIEARYVGTHNYAGWTAYNYNEYNIQENGFLNEFQLAQANLRANVAAGRGANFKYYGAGTGTSPLPIFLAYFNGVPQSQAADASKYTSSDFSSTTFVNTLVLYNPAPFTAADALDSSAARRANAIAAGLPSNFLIANPDMLGGANVTGNGGYRTYNGLQLDFRRRMAAGLQFQVNYAWGVSYDSNRYSFRVERMKTRQTYNDSQDGGVTHALKLNWVYELPFGKGRKWMADANKVADFFLGRWAFYGTGRIQSGRMLDFGNVRLVGMSADDLVKSFKIRVDGNQRVWALPDDIIDNTVKAYNTSTTSPTGYGALGAPTGRYLAPANSNPACIESISGDYGQCGTRTLVVTGPAVVRFDMSIAKQFPVVGRSNFEFRAEIFNVFNRVNFTPITGIGGTEVDDFEITGAIGTTYQSRTMQLVFRFNW